MTTVYITAPTTAADGIARELIDRQLAACVNRIECQSTYRWEGEIITEPETILIVKTTTDRYSSLVDAVTELHPYDVPCIERFEEADVLPSYAEWVAEETEG